MVQLQPGPVAVIVALPAVSPAVYLTVELLPELGLRLPDPLVIAQVAGPGLTVRSTSSPTPILVRARFAGEAATVCEVMVQEAQSCTGEAAGVAAPGPEDGGEGSFRQLMDPGSHENSRGHGRARSAPFFPIVGPQLPDRQSPRPRRFCRSKGRADHRSSRGQRRTSGPQRE